MPTAGSVTRDYQLEFDTERAPLLSVFGGKITTFRKLAEEAVDLVAAQLKHAALAWTATACLPGGDLFGPIPSNRSVLEFGQFTQALQARYGWLPAPLVARYARAYGTRIEVLLEGRGALADMGDEIAPGLFAAEVSYLMRHEWARSADDILWRRSKLGLHLPAMAAGMIDDWIGANPLN